MRTTAILALAAANIFMWSGCSQNTEPPKSDASPKPTAIVELPSEALQKVLVAGITRSDVIQVLGKPTSEMPGETGISYLDYVYQSPAKSPSLNGEPIGGVTIVLTNGYLARWSPILVQSEVSTTPDPNDTSGGKKRSGSTISLWLISNQTVTDGIRIDRGKFMHHGYIATRPDLILSNLVSVVTKEDVVESDGKKQTNFLLSVTISLDAAAGIEKFTRENQGRDILISMDALQLATISIRSSIKSQSLLLPIHDRKVYEQLRQEM